MYKIVLFIFIFFKSHAAEQSALNRPHYQHKSPLPPIPLQTKEYINIANYNIRTSYKDIDTPNAWTHRKPYYFETLRSEDEAYQLMKEMKLTIQKSLRRHLKESPSALSLETHCKTCAYSEVEPFPVFETQYFRIALKTSYDANGKLFGNFPYPYRLLIALKRHDRFPNAKEWEDLKRILEVLELHVSAEIGAEYTSYGVFQDVYFREKNAGKDVAETPHYILHFIFRFPHGVKIKETLFHDMTPYHQFEFRQQQLVCEDEPKPNSNFVFKRSPDIFTTQELTYVQTQDLKKQFPLYTFAGFTAYEGLPLEKVKPDTWIGECLAIAYRTDRFECLDQGVLWLSDTPSIPSKIKDSSRERIIMWAQLKDLHTGKVFYLFNTHYDHLGNREDYVKAEKKAIQSIAQDTLWFSVGERFYKSFDGEKLYAHYLNSVDCYDVRDHSLLGHYGESGTWGGFEDDPFLAHLTSSGFACDTLDNAFTNGKNATILFTYAINGVYDPLLQVTNAIQSAIPKSYRLASDHFMTGFYFLLQ